MTAEVAILNKTAVALAADSAVTISNGDTSYKTFDSADKLFELSLDQPIGIMFYGNGQFCGYPIANLVRDFRSDSGTFKTVLEAGDKFLKFLFDIAKGSPRDMKEAEYRSRILPVIKNVNDEVEKELLDRWIKAYEQADENGATPPSRGWVKSSIFVEKAHALSDILDKYDDAKFVGSGRPNDLPDYALNIFKKFLEEQDYELFEELELVLKRFALLLVQKAFLSSGSLGIVVAGFGSDEKFPTLYSAKVDGLLGNSLKFAEEESCDISRSGATAAIFSFAQRDVMDRFLFGFDSETEDAIRKFTKESVDEILDQVLASIKDEDEKAEISKRTREAQTIFDRSLRDKCFEIITQIGKNEIEDMIRFMPKPELAQMAESLINLTSMKRRVSRGMETVGGPVDVAVVSRSEGFVWVKRKHYFPAELNARYFTRLSAIKPQEDET